VLPWHRTDDHLSLNVPNLAEKYYRFQRPELVRNYFPAVTAVRDEPDTDCDLEYIFAELTNFSAHHTVIIAIIKSLPVFFTTDSGVIIFLVIIN